MIDSEELCHGKDLSNLYEALFLAKLVLQDVLQEAKDGD